MQFRFGLRPKRGVPFFFRHLEVQPKSRSTQEKASWPGLLPDRPAPLLCIMYVVLTTLYVRFACFFCFRCWACGRVTCCLFFFGLFLGCLGGVYNEKLPTPRHSYRLPSVVEHKVFATHQMRLAKKSQNGSIETG